MKKEKFENIVKRELPGLKEILKARECGFISRDRAREYYGKELGFICGEDKGGIFAEFVRRPEKLVFRPLSKRVLEIEPWENRYSSSSFFRSESLAAYVICVDGKVISLKSGYRQEWNDRCMKPQEEAAPKIGEQLASLGREVRFVVLVDSHEATNEPLIVRVTVYRVPKPKKIRIEVGRELNLPLDRLEPLDPDTLKKMQRGWIEIEEKKSGTFSLVGENITDEKEDLLGFSHWDDDKGVEDLDDPLDDHKNLGISRHLRWREVDLNLEAKGEEFHAPSLEFLREALEHVEFCSWNLLDI